ncbi:MAG: hypothetical protein JJU12_08625 [Chlamydiales bacterium]|nr:hypothetical protein [Chlamydiales bacterium]
MKLFLSILLCAFGFAIQAAETDPPEIEETYLVAEALRISEIIGSSFEQPAAMPQAARKSWICTKCKYRNYEGIEKCGVCGNSRHG